MAGPTCSSNDFAAYSARISELRAVSREDLAPGERARVAVELAGLLAERYEALTASGDLRAAEADLRLASDELELAISVLAPGQAGSAELAVLAGSAGRELWTAFDDAEARDRAIGHLDAAASLLAPDDPDLPEILASLAMLHGGRSERAQSAAECRADLDAAIAAARRGLEMAQDDAVSTELRWLLSLTLADRFGLAADDLEDSDAIGIAAARSDRDEAIDLAGPLVAELPGGEPDWLSVARTYGQLLHDRYGDPWPGATAADPGELDRAIEVLQAVADVDATPGILGYLVEALADRVSLTDAGAFGERAADLGALVGWGERLLAHPDISPGNTAYVHGLLGFALKDRFEAGPEAASTDLTAAIGHWEAALALTGPEDPDRYQLLAQLAVACFQRLGGDGTRHAELDQVTQYALEAWPGLPPDDELLVPTGLCAVTGLHERLRRPDEPIDVALAGTALEVLYRLEPLVAGDRDLHLPVLVELGHFLVSRGQVTGSGTDLADARQWVEQALAVMPLDDPGVTDLRQTLATSVFTLAALGTGLGHVNAAIRLLQAQVAAPSADPASAAMTRCALGLAHVQLAAHTLDEQTLALGIGQLRASFDEFATHDPFRVLIAWNLGSALLMRFMRTGDVQDRDAARYYLTLLDGLAAIGGSDAGTGSDGAIRRAIIDAAPDFEATRTAMAALLRLAEGLDGDAGAMDDAVRGLRTALAILPPGHPYEPRFRGDLGLALMLGAEMTNDVAGLEAGAHEVRAALASVPADHMMRPLLLLRAGGAEVAIAARTRDPGRLRAAIDFLSAALTETEGLSGGRVRTLIVLGTSCEQLYRLTGEASALRAAAEWLERACDALNAEPHHPEYARCFLALARVRRAQGQARQARDAGLAALRGRGREVLLQTGTSRALRSAGQAAGEAAEAARWCLRDNDAGAAVAALELGRGLLLHAATSTSTVPDLLVQAERADLAAEWRAQHPPDERQPWDERDADTSDTVSALLAGTGAPEVPSDLRARALAALAGTPLDRLLAPPAWPEIAAAVRATGADALVYLLGPDGARPGCAIAVRASGEASRPPELLPLPLLRRGSMAAIGDYVATYERVRVEDGQLADAETLRRVMADWEEALRSMCTWAWDAVMRPLLEWSSSRGMSPPARLVLVPLGQLSVVPWHAAFAGEGTRLPGGRPAAGPSRHLCAHAVISYAASARQLIEVSGRPVMPVQVQPVIVGNPTVDLVYAGIEAQAIRDQLYPGGKYLGNATSATGRPADGAARPGDVLGQLPAPDRAGASMVHLACHAVAVGADPGSSYLLLADHERLALDRVLRQASGRPAGTAGGLVCLAACESDLASGHYDEALTLATAFLAAGAVTVMGTRWAVADRRTALLMYMFHHFLTVLGQSPRDALRLAQLWMLDPGRTAPAGMPDHLARDVTRSDLADLAAWGAMTHQGR